MLQRRVAPACLISLALLVASAVAAAEEPGPPPPNVRVTIRLGRLEQGKPRLLKTYNLVVGDTRSAKLLSGARVPLPVGGDPAEKGAAFVYQNIGFSADVTVYLVGGGKIRIHAELEDSRLAETVAGRPPVVETRQLSFNSVVADGQPVEVTRVEGEADPSGFVEVEAKVMR